MVGYGMCTLTKKPSKWLLFPKAYSHAPSPAAQEPQVKAAGVLLCRTWSLCTVLPCSSESTKLLRTPADVQMRYFPKMKTLVSHKQ